MATLKLTLDKRRKYTDGRSPLILRLTNQGSSTSIPTGMKVHHSEWDSNKQRVLKKHTNQQDLNLALKDMLLDYEQKLVEIEAKKGNHLGLVELKELLVSDQSQAEVRFQDFVLDLVRHLQKQGRYGNAQSYLTASNRVVDFAGATLAIDSIDYQFLIKLESHLIETGVGVNGIAAYMRTIRAIVNSAGKLGKYDMINYPFGHYKIRTQKTVSRAESVEVIRQIANYDLPIGSDRFHARNTFLIIFGLIGISFIDLINLKKTDRKGNRIVYKRRKTGKLYSIKIKPIVQGLFAVPCR
jgi:integrase/recombinase XerD